MKEYRDVFAEENMSNLERLKIPTEDFVTVYNILSDQSVTNLDEQERLLVKTKIKNLNKIVLFINVSTILRSSYNHLETNLSIETSPLAADTIIKTDMDERRMDFMKVFAHSVLLNIEEDKEYQMNVLMLLINLLLSCKLCNIVETINFLYKICQENDIDLLRILSSTNVCFEFFNFSDINYIKDEKNYH